MTLEYRHYFISMVIIKIEQYKRYRTFQDSHFESSSQTIGLSPQAFSPTMILIFNIETCTLLTWCQLLLLGLVDFKDIYKNQ